MDFKTDALMLKAVDYGENDKMVTLLTAERGKIGACLKGVKKANARLKFAAQPFCFAEYVFAEKSGRHTVTSASLHDGFFPLREDVEKYYAAAVVCEACDKLMYEEMPGGELLVAAVTALSRMCTEDAAFPLITFLLTALRLAGYPLRAELPAMDETQTSPPPLEGGRGVGNSTSIGEPQTSPSRLETGRGVGNSPSIGEPQTLPPPMEGGRGVGALFFNMESGSFSLEKGTPASVVTYDVIREALGYAATPRTRDGEKRALRLLYSYFAYQTDSELTSLPEYVRMLY